MIPTSDRAVAIWPNRLRPFLAAAAVASLTLLGVGCAGSSGGQLDTAAGASTSVADAEIPLSDPPQSTGGDAVDLSDSQDPSADPTPLAQDPATQSSGDDQTANDDPAPSTSGAGVASDDAFLAPEAPGFWRVTGDGPVNTRLTPGLSGEIVGTLQAGESDLASTGRRAIVDDIEWKELVAAGERPIVWMAANLLASDQVGQAPAAGATSPPDQSADIDGLVFGVDDVVRFGAGGTSTTISDAVVRGERSRYRLDAGVGQTLNLDITSLEDNAVFDVLGVNGNLLVDEMTTASLVLPAAGRYTIIVGATRGNASYELTVSIPA